MGRSDGVQGQDGLLHAMRGDKEGGVPSIRAARRDESEAAVWAQRGPESERASARFQCAEISHSAFRESAITGLP